MPWSEIWLKTDETMKMFRVEVAIPECIEIPETLQGSSDNPPLLEKISEEDEFGKCLWVSSWKNDVKEAIGLASHIHSTFLSENKKILLFQEIRK